MSLTKTLIIVESPSKARTISKYLGKSYIVKASMGHVKDLPKNDLGVHVENGFEPVFVMIKGKEKNLREIRTAAKGADNVLVATDPDREGEAIGWHIAEEIKKLNKPIARIWLKEITREGIQEALNRKREIDRHRVEAQFTRRILDRLVGYQISPLLWDKVWRGLSAGRVQSVALRLIVERQREIQSFQAEEYWKIRTLLNPRQNHSATFWANLVRYRGKKIELSQESQALAAEQELRRARYQVKDVERKRRKQAPPPPFITARLQQEAAHRFRWPARKTMEVAQRLYEGVDLADGRTGLITYMRTDSTRVSEQAISAARKFVMGNYGKDAVPSKPHRYKSSSLAQDAHEAIRPTDVFRTPESLQSILAPDEWKLYAMIWKKFIASQMNPAEYDVTTVTVAAGEYELESRGEILVVPGFRLLYGENSVDLQENGEEQASDDTLTTRFPSLEIGDTLDLVKIETKQHFTQPPPPYTEATLIRELEKRGIGRPSTYAAILTIIQNRDYVTKKGPAFHPTPLGHLVCQLLEQFFPDLMDYKYTAHMEESLDKIEAGKIDRLRILSKFYKHFRAQLDEAGQAMPSYKKGASIGEPCPKCNHGELILRWSRNGGFLTCSNEDCDFKMDYGAWLTPSEMPTQALQVNCPRCDTPMEPHHGRHGAFASCPSCQLTLSLDGESPPVREDRECPHGHKPLVLKSGPYGLYYACIQENCKGTRPVYVDLPCPESNCDGEIVLRFFRKGKVVRKFYGCSRYPRCRFTTSGTLIHEPCPLCNAPFQVKVRNSVKCPNSQCSNKIKKYVPRKKKARTA